MRMPNRVGEDTEKKELVMDPQGLLKGLLRLSNAPLPGALARRLERAGVRGSDGAEEEKLPTPPSRCSSSALLLVVVLASS